MYAYLPRSIARDMSIVLMVMHQVIVFALFAFPLYFMAEKAVGVHSDSLLKRYAVRLPVGLLLWLIALAIPFFGVINDVLGAFTTTFETFIIPPLVYNVLYFHSANAAANRASAPRPPGRLLNKLGGWKTVKWFNWGISELLGVGKSRTSVRKGVCGSIGEVFIVPATKRTLHFTTHLTPLSRVHCHLWVWHGWVRFHPSAG